VLTVYDVGERRCPARDAVSGESLARRGRTSVDAALDVALQVARGLARRTIAASFIAT
jgi:hypothetical protein